MVVLEVVEVVVVHVLVYLEGVDVGHSSSRVVDIHKHYFAPPPIPVVPGAPTPVVPATPVAVPAT